jgi:two-component system, OmpR family, sensor histidine kinase ChvG
MIRKRRSDSSATSCSMWRIEASQAKSAPFDLEAMVRRVAARSSSVDQDVNVETPSDEDFVITGREDDLETALTNLVDNALRYAEGQSVRVVLRRDAMHASVSVIDLGAGIAAENLDKVWDRFFTTDADRGGTGLGLAIVRAIAEAHGGRAICESISGKGSTFTLLLPL